MAKNTWNAGDTGTRSRMNQPTWLMSGTVAAGGDPANTLRIYFSPGCWRFPYVQATVGSGQLQSFLHGATAPRYYTYFLRSNGSFMVSGSTIQQLPTPPRWDAEYLGQVFTGASLSTANLRGPWNAGAFDNWEQRGENVAITTLRSRAVYEYRRAATQAPISALGSYGNIGHIASSGLVFLSIDDRYDTGTLLSAAVSWLPSGAAGTTIGLQLMVTRGDNSAEIVNVADTYQSNVAQNPDGLTINSELSPRTTAFSAVCPSGTLGGYKLVMDMANAPAASTGVRIFSVSFVALLGYVTNRLTEP